MKEVKIRQTTVMLKKDIAYQTQMGNVEIIISLFFNKRLVHEITEVIYYRKFCYLIYLRQIKITV